MFNNRLLVPAFALTAALAACGGGTPTDPAMAEVMHERHEGFEEIGDAFKTIMDKLKAGESLDAEMAEAAKTINGYAPELETWFPEGSGPEAGKTDAKAEIWQQPQEFAESREAFVMAAAKFAELAEAGDAEGFAAQAREVGSTCKGCHDTFREDD
ncbi:cytochrome c [uncultured Abyssibacter sp.]|uniref:c-type cytochrome n=1 Tax=uncultured Abyssibacter sp. TaxID=2320202 RepID=UPI0032B1095E